MEQAQPSLDPVQQSLRASDQELYLASNCIGMLPSLCAGGGIWWAGDEAAESLCRHKDELNARTPPGKDHGWILQLPEK